MSNIVTLQAGSKVAGIIPRSLEEIYKLSETIFKSGLAPSGTRSADQVAVAILHGLEVGLPPLQAVQKISVINGRPALWGDAVPALLWSKGFKLDEKIEGEGDKTVAVCVVTRPEGSVIERRFSVEDAKRARLWGKQGPWSQYPARMLAMRARSFAARDGASEVLCGLYFVEEAVDIPAPKDITAQIIEVSKSEEAKAEAEQPFARYQEKGDGIKPCYVSQEQIVTLSDLLKGADPAFVKRFYKSFKIENLKDLRLSQYDNALAILEASKQLEGVR